jgi:hypothetical protein
MATRARPKPSGADPVKVDAKHYSVEFENEKVTDIRHWWVFFSPTGRSV